ncbi:hypothetical protein [Micromonospora sp. CPCC 205561]|uniref:hypothetical protein n=1 Tax=Micromonospora sp. CPCC 205561 TaxID=3122407 RepID=UPI002FF1A834
MTTGPLTSNGWDDPPSQSALARLVGDGVPAGDRALALAGLARDLVGTAVGGDRGRWMFELLRSSAPQLVRDQHALYRRFEVLGEPLADRVEETAENAAQVLWASAAVGHLAPLPGVALAKALGHVAIELRMVGELHAVYGCRPVATPPQWWYGLLAAWATRGPLLPGEPVPVDPAVVIQRFRAAVTELSSQRGRLGLLLDRGRDGRIAVGLLSRNLRRQLRFVPRLQAPTGVPLPPEPAAGADGWDLW